MFQQVPGSQKVDFIVWLPTPVVVPIKGKYWHEGDKALIDELNEHRILKHFNGNVRIVPLELDKNPISSVEDALEWIRSNL